MNLLLRIVVALIGVPAIVLMVALGSWALLLMVIAQVLLCSREFFNLASIKYQGAFVRTGLLLCLAPPVAAFAAAHYTGSQWLFPLAVLCAPVATAVIAMVAGAQTDGFISRISVTGFGIVYFGGLFALQIPLRAGPQGAYWLSLIHI